MNSRLERLTGLETITISFLKDRMANVILSFMVFHKH